MGSSEGYRPINTVSRLLGVSAVVGGMGRKGVQEVVVQKLYNAAILAGGCFISATTIYTFGKSSTGWIRLTDYRLSSIFDLITTLVSICILTRRARTIVLVLRLLDASDRSLFKLGDRKSHSRIRATSRMILLYGGSVLILSTGANLLQTPSLLMLISYKFYTTCNLAIHCQFLYLALAAATSFKALPSVIANLRPPQVKGRGSQVRTIVSVHEDLMKACRHVNSIYASYNLFSLTSNLVFVTIHSYTIISSFMDWSHASPGTTLQWALIVRNTCWVVIRITRTILLSVVCSWTSSQANNLPNEIHKLIDTSNAFKETYELEYFSLSLLHRKLHFTACGLFTIDLSIIHAMAGTIATYLVILVQFKLSEMSSLA